MRVQVGLSHADLIKAMQRAARSSNEQSKSCSGRLAPALVCRASRWAAAASTAAHSAGPHSAASMSGTAGAAPSPLPALAGSKNSTCRQVV